MADPAAGHLLLGQVRWPMLEGSRPLLLVPVGSMEQHGPHLPLGTDTMIAAAVTREAARGLDAGGRHVLVAPPLGYGASGEHEGLPGTISIGHEALRLLLVEFARSACRWVEGLIFVNGHGENLTTVASAVRQLRHEGRAVAWTACCSPDADAHAGRTETSVLRFIAPWSVLIDPTTSTVEEGKRVFAGMVSRVVQELTEIDVGDDGRLVTPVPRVSRGVQVVAGRRTPVSR
jgi:mycofactocin system creatininase family protein